MKLSPPAERFTRLIAITAQLLTFSTRRSRLTRSTRSRRSTITASIGLVKTAQVLVSVLR